MPPKTPEGRQKALQNLVQYRPAKREHHGAHAVRWSDEPVQRKREEILRLLEGDVGAVLKPADQTTVGLLAVALRQVELLNRHLEEKGPILPSGQVRPALEMLAKLLKVALDYAGQLGMTPVSRARLGLDVARTADIAQLLATPAGEADGTPDPEEGGRDARRT